jgi:hypothetical protein
MQRTAKCKSLSLFVLFLKLRCRWYLLQATQEVHSFSKNLEPLIHFPRKFIADYGEDAFYGYYLAEQRLLGIDELPGISRRYRKGMVNAPEAPGGQKEKGGGTHKKKKASKT